METVLSHLIKHDASLLVYIRKMLIHAIVLPVTSCEAESAFSALRRIKTFLRSQDRLTGLALLSPLNMYVQLEK